MLNQFQQSGICLYLKELEKRAVSHVRVAASSDHFLSSLQEELNIQPQIGIRRHLVAQPDQPFIPSSPKTICAREISSLTGGSSHEELNRPERFWRNHTIATPTVG